MEMKFCQSCGMPLTPEILGSNADGSKNEEYCIYCYKDGALTGDFNMEQMNSTRIQARALPAKSTRRNYASTSRRSSAGASPRTNFRTPPRP